MGTATLPYSSPIAGTLIHSYQACVVFIDQHKETVSSLAESLFYNRVGSISERKNNFLRSINLVALNNFHFLQIVLSTVNVVKMVYSTKQIFVALGYSFSLLHIAPLGLVVIAASGWMLSKAMKYPGIDKSVMQVLSGSLQLIDVMQSLALATFTENKISHLIRAGLNCYSLYKNNQFNWLSIQDSRKLGSMLPSDFSRPTITQLDVTYSALILKQPQEDACTICLEKNADQVFCTNAHAYHTECLREHLNARKEFLFKAKKYIRTDTTHYRNGSPTHTTHAYHSYIDEKNLPSCPQCREHPSHNHFDITVHDLFKGAIAATVIIQPTNPKNQQKTFEKVYALYCIFQGILGVLHQIPEFTGTISLLRRITIVLDIAMGTIANFYLINNLNEKGYNGFAGIIPAALTTIPLFLGLEHLFTPKDDLSKFNLNTVTVQWERPFIERVHCALNTYNLLTTFGLACFSKENKLLNATSLLSQAVSLGSVLNVHWLYVHQKNIGTLAAEFGTYTLLPAFWRNTETIKNSVSYITNLQQSIVKNGKLWRFNYTKLMISYTMEKIQDLREYLFKPYIWTWNGLTGKGTYYKDLQVLSVSLS